MIRIAAAEIVDWVKEIILSGKYRLN